ncbi:MAG: hypothetical protein R2686_04775 [Candidatus Nanopelagicales bacterium]
MRPASRQRGLHPTGVIARYVLLGAALGIPVAILWVLLAPRVVATSVDPAEFAEPYPQGFAATDLTLGALLLATGCVIGVVASWRLRATGFDRGWGQVLGVIAGAGMSAAVARVLGWWMAGRTVQPISGGFELPLTVGASGVLLLGMFSGLLVVLFYAAFAREPAAVTPESAPSGPA